MNNVFVYCEMEGKHVADVSLELLTKGRVSQSVGMPAGNNLVPAATLPG